MSGTAQDTLREVSDGINQVVSIAGAIEDPVGTVTGMVEDKANEVLANATNFISQALPSFPAAFLGSLAIGMPHAHTLHPPSGPPPVPPTPLPPIGAVMLGTCISVMINGLPAARSGDVGFNPTCCGLPPMFDIFTGSSKVFIGGKRAARMVDITVHCKPGEGGAAAASGGALETLGQVATAAAIGADVMDAVEGDPAAQARLAVMAAQAAADAVADALKATMGMDVCVPAGTIGMVMLGAPNVLIGGFPMPSWSAVAKGFQKLLKGLKRKRPKGNNDGCGRPGEPVDVVTGANVDSFIDFEIPGSVPFVWQRHYDSKKNGTAGPLGWGHTHNYLRQLRCDLDGFLYTRPDGEDVAFAPFPTDQDAVQCDGCTLRWRGPGWYELEEHGQPTLDFHLPNLLDPHAPCAPQDSLLQAFPCRLRARDSQVDLHYDTRGRLSTVDGANGLLLSLKYDEQDRIKQICRRDGGERVLCEYGYDAAGNLITWRDAAQSYARYGYDEARRMIQKTDRRGYSYYYQYDAAGRCVRTFGEDGLYDVSFEYHPLERRTVATFADGAAWTHLYDQVGTITKIINPLGGALERQPNASGQVAEEVDPKGNATKLLYSKSGALMGRIDPLGGFVPPRSREPYPLSPHAHYVPASPVEWECGELAASVWPMGLRAFGKPRSVSAPPLGSGRAVGRTVNDLGWKLEEQDLRGAKRRWRHDANGNVVSYQDGDGHVRRYRYKSWNLLSESIDALGNVTAYDYSLRESITRVTDPGGTVSEYVYDPKNRLVRVCRSGAVREEYRYDSADNLILKLDGQGRILLSCDYGPGNLLTRRRLGSGGQQRFAYDAAGRLTKATTGEFTCEFDHDGAGRTLKDKRDGRGVTHQYHNGRLARTTVLGRFTVLYEWSGKTLELRDPCGTWHQLDFAAGELRRCMANREVEVARYDDRGLCLEKVLTDPAGRCWRRSYRYSPEGDLSTTEDSERGLVRYHHDAAHRLTTEVSQGGNERSFRYDGAGNLVEQPGLRQVAIHEENQLRWANGEHFSYDLRGQVTQRERSGKTVVYEYDSLDMMVRSDGEGGEWRAVYDPLGRRVSKETMGGKTEFYWDTDRLAAEVFPDGALRVYVYADAVSVVPLLFVDYDSVDADAATGRIRYLSTDQIGAPLEVRDQDRHRLWQAQIRPYGQAELLAPAEVQLGPRWAGHYADEELGLHYNRFRYYSPALGRYLQSDPIGISGGINLYQYPASPLTRVDVRGLHDDGDHTQQQSHEDNQSGHPQGEGNTQHGNGHGPQQSAFPGLPRTDDAHQHANNVAAAMGPGAPGERTAGITAKTHGSVTVITHEQPPHSVGISGGSNTPAAARDLQAELDRRHGPGQYQVNGDYPPDTTGMRQIPGARTRPGECSEPRAAQAASQNPTPPTGYDTVWRGKTENQYPLEGGHPNQMAPCGNCGDSQNAQVMQNRANRGSSNV